MECNLHAARTPTHWHSLTKKVVAYGSSFFNCVAETPKDPSIQASSVLLGSPASGVTRMHTEGDLPPLQRPTLLSTAHLLRRMEALSMVCAFEVVYVCKCVCTCRVCTFEPGMGMFGHNLGWSEMVICTSISWGVGHQVPIQSICVASLPGALSLQLDASA